MTKGACATGKRAKSRAEHRPGIVGVGSLLGTTPAMLRLYEKIGRMAPSNASVFLVGESGTGKELVAGLIHDLSGRDGEFIAVNCGAISPNLIESELFGHEKGSFSGASRRHRGCFERAAGGTLFLDEITEMPLELQVKLLRVLETRSFHRVGGEEPLSVELRVIAATNRDPLEAVEEGVLRQDLFYRLNVLRIDVPPLRERMDDVPILAETFIRELSEREGRQSFLPPDVLHALMAYGWPGNVRELRNALHTALLLSDGDEVLAEALPPEVVACAPGPFDDLREDGVRIPVGVSLQEAERRLILHTLEHVDGSKPEAARVLGVSLKTLYNRLHEYGFFDERDEEVGDSGDPGAGSAPARIAD